MKLLSGMVAVSLLCAGVSTTVVVPPALTADEEQGLLRADHALFHALRGPQTLNADAFDSNFTWTDALGNTHSRSEITADLRSGRGLPREAGIGRENSLPAHPPTLATHVAGRIGVIQENRGKLYILRVWVKREDRWKLLVYQAVSIGAPPSSTPGKEECDNPCNTVPFEPKTQAELEVIHAYQAVERAVTAHDSAAWGSHIAEEFFAVTSNSDRPLDKAARMAGLDNQKVAGIAPFPLVSARMFEFGDALVMISLQQPKDGLPLHVTRVWFRRKGAWLEAYSYQTTIHDGQTG
jgi:hypothetical protein